MSLQHIATHRVTERDMLAACAASGQMDPSQMYAHEVAGEMLIEDKHAGVLGYAGELPLNERDIGVECHIPDTLLAPGIEFAGSEPRNWQRIGWWCLWIVFAIYMLIAYIGR